MSSSEVYFLISGNWMMKETYGEVPPNSSTHFGARAFVVNDKMLVHVLQSTYSLDLNTLTWSRLNPKGTRPPAPFNQISWLHKGNIYFLSNPAEVNNKIFFFNTSQNYWETHNHSGQIPSSHSDTFSTISNDDTVFIISFKQILIESRATKMCSGLYMLDMRRMHWIKIHNTMPDIVDSGGIWSKSTFTFISNSTAVLQFGRSDYWLLDVQSAKELKKPSSIWTQIPNRFRRIQHAAVFEPKSQKLWVIGGLVLDGNYLTTSSDVLKMTFHSHDTLKELAIDHVICNMSTDDERLLPGQLPRDLKNDVELYRKYNF